LLTLWDKKALDINQPEVRQEIYDLFGETGMNVEFNLDATRARIENIAMREGKPVQPMPEIEDMTVHLLIHKRQCKELAFDQWSPESKQLMFAHITATSQALQQQQMQAQIQADQALAAQSVAKHAGLHNDPFPPEGAIPALPGQEGPSNAQGHGQQGAAASARTSPNKAGSQHPSAPAPGTPVPGGPQPAAPGRK
jgi:hypothetical protein